MGKNYNNSFGLWLRDMFCIKGQDQSSEYSDVIQPVIHLIPRRSDIRHAFANKITTTSVTMLTTPADIDFYLCGYTLSVTKDVTADLTNTRLRGVINGVSFDFAGISGLTTTAQNSSIAGDLSFPVKLDRNSTILLIGAFTVGTANQTASVYGFTMETGK